MTIKQSMINIALATGVFGAAVAFSAQANITEASLQGPQNFGFTHIEKIEYEGRGRIEVDGWGEDGWYLEVEFDGNDVLEEKRQRTVVQPWGLTFEQVNQILALAQEEGFARVDEIEIEQDGRIEVEGRDANDRKVEINIRVQSLN
ncbi:PepSY domain-containing protein [Aliidiomarina maris]|uniref:YpeB-like protein with putative protease inhibitory function n=1 Tax=Aliidiomarina maris TaxID=531312 RepID=A0A327X2B2_9GAMM|nr:PepSY domain-containing protein [Aliidiomarina maris]RAJ98444.1 YpeB-like protein with putative protease inhibitory function [Aliidiomarina maris]RUO24742.1 hypothetical protein CWE07_06770 [Aliidiomarina maris]